MASEGAWRFTASPLWPKNRWAPDEVERRCGVFKKILQAMPAALAFFLAAYPAQAVETGMSIYPKGLTGFMSGSCRRKRASI